MDIFKVFTLRPDARLFRASFSPGTLSPWRSRLRQQLAGFKGTNPPQLRNSDRSSDLARLCGPPGHTPYPVKPETVVSPVSRRLPAVRRVGHGSVLRSPPSILRSPADPPHEGDTHLGRSSIHATPPTRACLSGPRLPHLNYCSTAVTRPGQARSPSYNHRAKSSPPSTSHLPTLTFRGALCFFVIDTAAADPPFMPRSSHSDWLATVAEAFALPPFRYAIFDRDAKFSPAVRELLTSSGIKPVRTSIRSPWQNGTAERWIGNARRELLDHVIPLNEEHLRRLGRECLAYYHQDRTHIGLRKTTPANRPVEQRSSPTSELAALPRIGGLHHRYTWSAAA